MADDFQIDPALLAWLANPSQSVEPQAPDPSRFGFQDPHNRVANPPAQVPWGAFNSAPLTQTADNGATTSVLPVTSIDTGYDPSMAPPPSKPAFTQVAQGGDDDDDTPAPRGGGFAPPITSQSLPPSANTPAGVAAMAQTLGGGYTPQTFTPKPVPDATPKDGGWQQYVIPAIVALAGANTGHYRKPYQNAAYGVLTGLGALSGENKVAQEQADADRKAVMEQNQQGAQATQEANSSQYQAASIKQQGMDLGERILAAQDTNAIAKGQLAVSQDQANTSRLNAQIYGQSVAQQGALNDEDDVTHGTAMGVDPATGQVVKGTQYYVNGKQGAFQPGVYEIKPGDAAHEAQVNAARRYFASVQAEVAKENPGAAIKDPNYVMNAARARVGSEFFDTYPEIGQPGPAANVATTGTPAPHTPGQTQEQAQFYSQNPSVRPIPTPPNVSVPSGNVATGAYKALGKPGFQYIPHPDSNGSPQVLAPNGQLFPLWAPVTQQATKP